MIGLEPTWDQHLVNLMQVFDEVWRVMRNDATLWLNYGDAYAGGGRGGGSKGREATGHSTRGGMINRELKPKNLMMMPARIALAMQERGWVLRSEIVWAKRNPMPESVRDRPTSGHEKIFLFAKQPKYFYDHVAARTQSKDPTDDLRRMTYRTDDNPENRKRFPDKEINGIRNRTGSDYNTGTANLRNVWHLATESFSGAHFAVMPTKIVESCIKAGSSEHGVCDTCGAPYVRDVKNNHKQNTDNRKEKTTKQDQVSNTYKGLNKRYVEPDFQTKDWIPTCECKGEIEPGVVLDPFGGAGTVSVVAERLGRDSVICEISPEYAEIARKRIADEEMTLFPTTIEIINQPGEKHGNTNTNID